MIDVIPVSRFLSRRGIKKFSLRMGTTRKDLNYRVNMSRRYRFLYVETPKVACSTIKLTLQSVEAGEPVPKENVHNKQRSPLLSPQDDWGLFKELLNAPTAFRFTFVRHPYTRVLSAYLEKIVESAEWKQHSVFRERRSELGLPVEGPVSFAQFVAALCDADPRLMDNHWRPLSRLTVPHVIDYDFIGRFENFSRDLAFVCETIGLEGSAPRVVDNHATGASERVKEHYSPGVQRMVDEIYRDDFELFGYERDIANAA